MPRIPIVYRAADEAGNAIGGSPQQVRIWDNFACTVASVVTDDSAGGTTIAQPLIPNSGAYTTLAVTTAAVDATITVASTTGFAVGQLITIYDPTNTVYRFIRAILSGPPRLTLESAVGFIFSTTNTQVGNLDQVGVVGGWVLDTSYHYSQVTDVASGRKGPPQLISNIIGSANVGVLEEGAGGGTRPTVNFIGASTTAVDNPGSSRVDVTMTGLQADGTEAAPSIGFVADPDTGLYRIGANNFAAVVAGKRVQEWESGGSAVNLIRFQNAITAVAPIIYVAGTDTDVGLRLSSKGAGAVTLYSGSVGRTLANFLDTASSVNYFEFRPAAAGAGPQLLGAGSDANVRLNLYSKGAGTIILASGSGARVMAEFEDVASAVNWLNFAPSAASGVLPIRAVGSDTNIDINFTPKGTGVIRYKSGAQLWPLLSASQILAADVTMTSANTWYDGPGISLLAGTWMVFAALTVQSGNTVPGYVTARLTDGSTHYGSVETQAPASVNGPVALSPSALITLGSTTTIKAQAVCSQNAGAILAATPHNGSGNNATQIIAFRVLTS